MAAFAALYVAMMARGSRLWREDGFYLAVGFYAVQRFVWEFLKPYDPVLAGMTVFQLLSIALPGNAVERSRDRRMHAQLAKNPARLHPRGNRNVAAGELAQMSNRKSITA